MPQKVFGHILYGSWRVVFVVIWGGGLLGEEVQHMAVQKQRIWEHIYLHRLENVWFLQCFTVGKTSGFDLKIKQTLCDKV